MGKTAPNKQKGGTSIHSRAVRRATSPGIDTDKSLKDVKPPSDYKNQRPSVLAVHQGAGVSKKSKNGRKSVLSAKAKRRMEKGLDRAEAVMDKKETRIQKSRGKARTVQERAKAWEELNKKILEKKAKDEKDAEEMENWVDEGEDLIEDEGQNGMVGVDGDLHIEDAPVADQVVPEDVPLPDAADDKDEVL